MKITSGMKLTDEQIARLEGIGFRRWTKYGKDRLYANADVIGMELDFYKSSGAISHSVLNGEEISHRQAGKILDRIDGAYIDVMTGKIYAKSGGHEYIEAAVEAIDDTENEPEEEDNTMKITVTYESGPAREGIGSVDYMIADISDLDLDRDELYAEADPYDYIPEMGGVEKLVKLFPAYEAVIRDFFDSDDEARGTDAMNELLKAMWYRCEEIEGEEITDLQDFEWRIGDFWDKLFNSFIGDAYKYTEPHLKAEIIAQAEALGIAEDQLVF